MSFEARYHRFSTIRSMSFLSEKLFGPLQVKHAIYLMMAIMFAWRGLSAGNANAIAFAIAIAFLGLVSAVVGVRSMSFEAKIFVLLYSLFDSMFSGEPKDRERARSGGMKVKRARSRLVLRESAPLLSIVVALCSFAIYVAITSRAPITYRFLAVSASLLLIAITVALSIIGAPK